MCLHTKKIDYIEGFLQYDIMTMIHDSKANNYDQV